jgi:FKBP-type peptidyl-prolyl cis-trans isomerase (trigger factor)
MCRPVADDAVAFADGVVEAGQAFAARGGLDPEAELADLDGLGVEVHAVEVVLEDLPVEIEQGALPAQFLQPGVGESNVQAGIGFINGAE